MCSKRFLILFVLISMLSSLSFSQESSSTSNPVIMQSNEDYLKETILYFSQTLQQLKKNNETSASLTSSLLFTLPNLMNGLQSMDQRLTSWDSSILKIDSNLLVSEQILNQQKQNFPFLLQDSKEILALSAQSKESIQKMEVYTQKWNDDLKNLQKDISLILNKKNTENLLLKGGIVFLIAERIYNLITGKILFLF